MQILRISIIAIWLAQFATTLQGEEIAQWDNPTDKKCSVFPTRAKDGTRQLSAIFAEPDKQPRSCSIRLQLDFDSLVADKERIEKAHPGWTVQRLAPTEITSRAELVSQASDGQWQTIVQLLPDDPQKPNTLIINENGLRASIVVTDESATSAREDSAAYQLFEQLDAGDPKIQLRWTITLKRGSQATATYAVDTAKLVAALGSEPFTVAELEQACEAAVKWEKGGDSTAARAELVNRLTKQFKLVEQSSNRPSKSGDAESSRRLVLTERALQSSKLKMSMKDSFAFTNPEMEREVVYFLKDWNDIFRKENSLRRSDKQEAKSEVSNPTEAPKPEYKQAEKNEPPFHANAKELWEVLRGPKGHTGARGAWPSRLTLDTSRDSGFRLVKYSMTNDESNAPKQGGYIQFRLLASHPPVGLGENILPAELAWTALEMRLGPEAILRKLTYDKPTQLSFFVDSKLSRQEMDSLWLPVSITDSDGRKRKANRAEQPLIRSHAVAHDYVWIDDADALTFRAERAAFYKACQAWSARTRESSIAGKDVAFRCGSAEQIESFIEFCMDQPSVFSKLTPRPHRLEQKLALFAQLRQAWLRYDLLDSGANQALQVVVQPSEAEAELVGALDRTLQGWSLVERYRQLETDRNQSDWVLEELLVHGYERETDQRVHFWPIGEWDKRGVQSVGIEAQFTDAKSNFSKSQKFLMPIDKPYVWQFKSRYSEQLSLRWRVYACRMKDGSVKTAAQPMAWETREPAGVFDEIVYLDDSTANSVLGSTASGS